VPRAVHRERRDLPRERLAARPVARNAPAALTPAQRQLARRAERALHAAHAVGERDPDPGAVAGGLQLVDHEANPLERERAAAAGGPTVTGALVADGRVRDRRAAFEPRRALPEERVDVAGVVARLLDARRDGGRRRRRRGPPPAVVPSPAAAGHAERGQACG
jgi:hypothetical protein